MYMYAFVFFWPPLVVWPWLPSSFQNVSCLVFNSGLLPPYLLLTYLRLSASHMYLLNGLTCSVSRPWRLWVMCQSYRTYRNRCYSAGYPVTSKHTRSTQEQKVLGVSRGGGGGNHVADVECTMSWRGLFGVFHRCGTPSIYVMCHRYYYYCYYYERIGIKMKMNGTVCPKGIRRRLYDIRYDTMRGMMYIKLYKVNAPCYEI